jgi:hypothetical protein
MRRERRERSYHVVSGDEGVVDGDELDIVALQGNPGYEPADPAEPCTHQPKNGVNTHTIHRARTTFSGSEVQKHKSEAADSPLIPILIFAA